LAHLSIHIRLPKTSSKCLRDLMGSEGIEPLAATSQIWAPGLQPDVRNTPRFLS